MSGIYHGRGNEELYEDYIDFINYVFGFNGDSGNFIKLLPKLYKPEYEPVKSSYITLDNGKIKAAVGAFDHEIKVCGKTLRCRGIGNVAVHPFARSKGYMKTLMNMAVDDMVKDGIDLSILGGRRQRYNYFSYEESGTAYKLTLNNDNMRHCYGTDRSAHYTVKINRVDGSDAAELESITKLLEKRDYNPCRPAGKLYDILCSWECVPYAVYKEDKFAGLLIFKNDTINEIVLADPADFADTLITFYDKQKLSKLTVTLPPFDVEYLRTLYRVCEGYTLSPAKSYSVLNFRHVTEAFLKLKMKYEKLPDGELKLLVHGRAGDENILIKVKGGAGSVSENTGAADLELLHIDAMNMLFSTFCPGRESLPDFARIWLPLPLWLYYTDAV